MERKFMDRVIKYSRIDKIDMNMKFKDDLLYDSLKFTKLIVELEEEFDIEFDDDTYIVNENIRLVDVFKMLELKVGSC